MRLPLSLLAIQRNYSWGSRLGGILTGDPGDSVESNANQVATAGRPSWLKGSSNQESTEDTKRTRDSELKNEGGNTRPPPPHQREEEEETWRSHGRLNILLGFCEVGRRDVCKSGCGENERISSDMPKSRQVDTWGGEKCGGGSLPTEEAGMQR